MKLLHRALAAGAAAVVLPLGALACWVARPLPSGLLDRAPAREALVVEDRHGLPLRTTRAADGSRAAWAPYAELDPDLINAFVAVEDRRFWDHAGVDPRALARAAWQGVRRRRVVSGASTLTMQLARLVRPAPRSWAGKLTQAAWALRLEQHLDKQRILEEYLNRVHLGDATAGVAAASARYFGAAPSALSVGQAALLAGIAHAPARDGPLASPARARARRAAALARMRRLGYASADDARRAEAEPVAAGPPGAAPFLAPHFAARVLAWQAAEAPAPNTERDGRVRTSLDLPLQEALEAEVRHTVDALRDRGVAHAAAVALDNRTGEVLAWVGSPDFWAPGDGQTDMVVSPRQPGSALKPFLYALAFDRGVTPATVLPDVPRAYATAAGSYRPRDYDRRFRGPVRAREALASSYNVPAVELAERLGAPAFLRTLHLAGFASLARGAEHYGLGLALGNGDVTLLELANGYRALANGGEWRPWTWRPVDPGAAPAGAGRRVTSAVASALVLDVLADAAARVPGFGAATPFEWPFPVAVKTGTSRHFTDNWAVGVTGAFTVAVWAGNFAGRPMEGVSGVTGAGPLLHRAVLAVSRRVPPGALPTPAEAGAVAVPVCRLSGLVATAECAQLTEWFAPGTAPTRADDWEAGGRVRLPAEYAEWAGGGAGVAADGGLAPQVAPPQVAPPQVAPGAAAEARLTARRESAPAGFRIVSPLDGDEYAVPPGVDGRYASVALRAAGPGAERVRWTVDGVPHDGARWALRPGAHVVRALSARGEAAEARIVVGR